MKYKGMKLRKVLGYWVLSLSYSKTVYLHRYIWEEEYGSIPDKMILHHKDGDGSNNDLSNLELMSHTDHRRTHAGWSRDEDGWTHKPCPNCGLKPLSEFYKQKNGYQSLCKPCSLEASSKFDKEHIEATRKRKREYWRRKVAKEKASLHPVDD